MFCWVAAQFFPRMPSGNWPVNCELHHSGLTREGRPCCPLWLLTPPSDGIDFLGFVFAHGCHPTLLVISVPFANHSSSQPHVAGSDLGVEIFEVVASLERPASHGEVREFIATSEETLGEQNSEPWLQNPDVGGHLEFCAMAMKSRRTTLRHDDDIRKTEARRAEYLHDDGEAPCKADTGHVDESLAPGEACIWATQWIWHGDGGLVETQLGCRHHEPGSDPTSA